MQAPVLILLGLTTLLGVGLLASYAGSTLGWLAPLLGGVVAGLYLQPSTGLLLGVVVIGSVLSSQLRAPTIFLRSIFLTAAGLAFGYGLQLLLAQWSAVDPVAC